jgi:hypothetical protein
MCPCNDLGLAVSLNFRDLTTLHHPIQDILASVGQLFRCHNHAAKIRVVAILASLPAGEK